VFSGTQDIYSIGNKPQKKLTGATHPAALVFFAFEMGGIIKTEIHRRLNRPPHQ
jgi:hypothetical protein